MSPILDEWGVTRRDFYDYLAERGEWRLRAVRPEETGVLVDFHRRIFGGEMTIEKWRWKYAALPGGEPAALAAEDLKSGRLIGYEAGIPCRMKAGERSLSAYFLADAMIEESSRAQGLHAHLTIALCEEIHRRGGLPLGLPNEDALGSVLKMGATRVATPRLYAKPLSWARLVTGSRIKPLWPGGFRPSGHRGIRIVTAAAFEDEADDLWRRVRPTVGIAVEREAGFLNWRYRDSPGGRYETLAAVENGRWSGYAVTRHFDWRGRRVGVISDFLCEPGNPAAGQALLAEAESRFRASGAAAMAGVFALSAEHEKPLLAAGFRVRRLKGVREFHLVADLAGAKHFAPERYEGVEALLKTESAWFFSLGDTDIG